MAFGSYDESEQEQPDREEEDLGEDMTQEIKGKEYQGTDQTDLGDEEKLFENLR
jgi:hypothetical protein